MNYLRDIFLMLDTMMIVKNRYWFVIISSYNREPDKINKKIRSMDSSSTYGTDRKPKL